MDHRRFHSRHLNLVLVFGCMAVLAGLGCGGTSPRSGSGSGGASGGAGGSGSGGTSTGGSGGGSGGAASGGVSGGGSGGSGGAGGGAGSEGGAGGNLGGSGGSEGGAGGNISGGAGGGGAGGKAQGGAGGVATSCSGDGDCSGGSPLCESTLKLCVQCLKSSDCPLGGHCLGNQCVTYTTCNDSRDCKSADLVCDLKRGLCFQCNVATDCTSGQACVNNACVAAPACQASSDCGGKVCDTDNKRCVECVADGDCGSDSKRCIQNTCRGSCTSDKQCTPDGKLCDTATSLCVLCKSNADCPSSSYCEVGLCKPDVCDSTQTMCSGDGVAACNAAGSSWGAATACESSSPCKVVGGVASCGGLGMPDGGTTPIDGGSTPSDGGYPSDTPIQPGCTTDQATPCTGLPKFAGVQTVDGNGDDMCSVPSFTFTKGAAAKVNNYNNIPDSQFESVLARVAWSSAGLHAFFDVTDASVQSVNTVPGVSADQALTKSYQGDSIEIYISSNNTVTGLTGTDNNSLHVVVPATGPAVSVKTDNSGGGTPAALPAAQYKQAKTSGGYAIEVLLPWPGGAADGGSQVRFDMAINSADSTFGGVDDMRDAQVIYYVGTATPSTCGGAVEPYCDNRAWCATILQQ